jgi:hypothetical protein
LRFLPPSSTLVFIHLLFRDGAPLNLFYSTSNTINQLNLASLRIPIFQSAELDDNRDGRIDRIEIGMQMPLAPTESIHGFTAFVYCTAQLQSKAKYIFDAAAYTNYESMSAMTQLNIDGDLMFRQSWPLQVKGGYVLYIERTVCHPQFVCTIMCNSHYLFYSLPHCFLFLFTFAICFAVSRFRVPYNKDPLIELKTGTSANDVAISSVMKRYNSRNCKHLRYNSFKAFFLVSSVNLNFSLFVVLCCSYYGVPKKL